jgi:hypothetical protein
MLREKEDVCKKLRILLVLALVTTKIHPKFPEPGFANNVGYFFPFSSKR